MNASAVLIHKGGCLPLCCRAASSVAGSVILRVSAPVPIRNPLQPVAHACLCFIFASCLSFIHTHACPLCAHRCLHGSLLDPFVSLAIRREEEEETEEEEGTGTAAAAARATVTAGLLLHALIFVSSHAVRPL